MKTNTTAKGLLAHFKTRFFKLTSTPSFTTPVLVSVAACLLLAVPCVRADTSLSAADNGFVLAAAQGGMTEVTLGALAAQKAVRADVREFGQLMVTDHTTINENLQALAAEKGVTLPDGLDAKHQTMVDQMKALTGADFDNAYIAAMLKGHKADAKAFKAEAAKTQDADLKSFLAKSLPIVEKHLKHITAINKPGTAGEAASLP